MTRKSLLADSRSNMIYTPRENSGNRGPKRVYDYLETKLVLRHLPSMIFSTSSLSSSEEEEDIDNSPVNDSMEDNKEEKVQPKRPDSPRPI